MLLKALYSTIRNIRYTFTNLGLSLLYLIEFSPCEERKINSAHQHMPEAVRVAPYVTCELIYRVW